MNQYVFVSERGNDKHDGLDESRPVRSAAKAIKISIKTGREVRAVGRLGKERDEQRKASNNSSSPRKVRAPAKADPRWLIMKSKPLRKSR